MPETQAVEQVPLEAKSPFVLRVHLSRSVTDADARAALETGEMGFLHSFTTGSTVDGPGVRLVAWTAGCMFHCLFCHNPDTWDMKNGMPTTIQRAKEELRKYRSGLKIMSGGLTVSGGEPLMQHRFVLKLFRAANSMGIHTALDTNGYLGSRLTDDDLKPISLVMMSIKAWDPERHRRLTGMEIEPTLAFGRRLASLGKPLWIRYVLVPGLTDDPDEVSQIAHYAESLGNVERVEVLPFHQMGRYKWKELGMNYTLQNVEPPSTELVERTCEQFRSVGLNAL
ncbi:MAG: pyruvate formate-lyase-activating protein [Bryobacteraceae bacterium]